MFKESVINKFRKLQTPFYYYDISILEKTLQCVSEEAGKYGSHDILVGNLFLSINI